MSNEELVAAIQRGEDRMGELWEQVERLVSWKASRVISALEGRGGVVFEDLYQSGYPALVAAVGSYKPECGAFSTWFMYCLKTAFAEATGYRTQRGRNEPLNNSMSLDMPLTDDADDGDLMDVIPDPAGMSGLDAAEDKIYRQQLHEAMEAALDSIPEQYSEILRLRHYQGLTRAQIGELQGVSWDHVHQTERKAIQQMRRPNIVRRLRPFYDFDCYHGTGLGAFRYTGMSIQERYLVIEEERKRREEKDRSEFEETAERIRRMTPEERAQLLRLFIT